MAGRILGQGDVVALVEKAAATMDAEAAQRFERKARSKRGMDLADFLIALKQMQAMGPIKQVLGLLPGVNAQALKTVNADDKRLKHVEAILLSMTPDERADPSILGGWPPRRIPSGAGWGWCGGQPTFGPIAPTPERSSSSRWRSCDP